jgi:hypothetical protein
MMKPRNTSLPAYLSYTDELQVFAMETGKAGVW